MLLRVIKYLYIVEIEYRKFDRSFYYKTKFSDPYKECDFLQKRFDVKSEFSRRRCARGISEKKKLGIISCLKGPGVSRLAHHYWNSLPVNNDSNDLAENLV